MLKGIAGKYFRWKDSGKRAYGVIAQDVEAAMPEAVHVNDAGYRTVEYDQLIAPLVEAVKALKAANDNQAVIIDEMRTEIDLLKRRAGEAR